MGRNRVFGRHDYRDEFPAGRVAANGELLFVLKIASQPSARLR